MATVFEGATFEEIELALLAKLGGAVAPGDRVYRSSKATMAGKDVALFFERPDLEHFKDRIFPAMSFEFEFMLDRMRMESYVGSRRTLSADPVPLASQYPDGQPYIAKVTATLHARRRVELLELEQLFLDIFQINDYVVDPNGRDWFIRRNTTQAIAMYDADQKTYLKVYPLEIDFVYLPRIAEVAVPTVARIVVDFSEAEVSVGGLDITEDGVTVT